MGDLPAEWRPVSKFAVLPSGRDLVQTAKKIDALCALDAVFLHEPEARGNQSCCLH